MSLYICMYVGECRRIRHVWHLFLFLLRPGTLRPPRDNRHPPTYLRRSKERANEGWLLAEGQMGPGIRRRASDGPPLLLYLAFRRGLSIRNQACNVLSAGLTCEVRIDLKCVCWFLLELLWLVAPMTITQDRKSNFYDSYWWGQPISDMHIKMLIIMK